MMELAVVAALAALASFSQSLSGFGFNLLLVPPLTLVLGAKEAVVTATMMGTITSFLTLTNMRASVEWRLGGLLFGAAALGMPFGLLVLITVDSDLLRVLIAITVLVAAVFYWKGFRVRTTSTSFDVAAGFISGVLNTSTSMSGPPLVLYLQNRGIAPPQFRATINAFFLASGLLATCLFVLGHRIGQTELNSVLISAPLIAIGWMVGQRAFVRIDVVRFERVVLVVLFLSSVMAISGVVGQRGFT
jgi:uncharacterized membrane protein YfcA